MASKREEKILRNAHILRQREHRLRPSLKLTSLKEAEKFVQNKGLVSVLGGNELPGLVSAFLGRDWKLSGQGFSGWLEWWSLKVSGENLGRALTKLEQSRVLFPTRIFRRSKTLVSRELWPILEPIAQHFSNIASKQQTFSRLETRILDHIHQNGRIRTDRLRDMLRLHEKSETARFHSSLTKLESYALIIGAEDPHPERHLHANIWSHWKSMKQQNREKRDLSYREAVGQLLLKTLDSAVLAPEKEIPKWFRWKESALEAKEELLNSGRIIQAENFLVTPRAATPAT